MAVLTPKPLNLTLVLEFLVFVGDLSPLRLVFGLEFDSSRLRPVLTGEVVSRLDRPNMPPIAWNWRSAAMF